MRTKFGRKTLPNRFFSVASTISVLLIIDAHFLDSFSSYAPKKGISALIDAYTTRDVLKYASIMALYI